MHIKNINKLKINILLYKQYELSLPRDNRSKYIKQSLHYKINCLIVNIYLHATLNFTNILKVNEDITIIL